MKSMKKSTQNIPYLFLQVSNIISPAIATPTWENICFLYYEH